MHVNEDHADLHGSAFAELVAYMEDFRMEGSVAPVFKFTDLAHLYKLRLEQLGVVIEGRVHISRLKLRLLSVFPDLRAHLQGRNVMLSLDDDIGDALKKLAIMTVIMMLYAFGTSSKSSKERNIQPNFFIQWDI